MMKMHVLTGDRAARSNGRLKPQLRGLWAAKPACAGWDRPVS